MGQHSLHTEIPQPKPRAVVRHNHHRMTNEDVFKTRYAYSFGGAALMHEHRSADEPGAAELMQHMTPVDLLIIEGFKREDHDKMEIHRRETRKPLLYPGDSRIVAVLSDEPLPDCTLPVIDLDDAARIADFIIRHCRLPARGAKPA